jgi:hypothetical protein
MKNRDNIQEHLKKIYPSPALVPPMNWLNRSVPMAPRVTAERKKDTIVIQWQTGDHSTHKIAIQGRLGSQWQTLRICPAESGGTTIRRMDAIALTAVNRYGQISLPIVFHQP